MERAPGFALRNYAFHDRFHVAWPGPGRGNFVATSAASLLLPGFFDHEGFSKSNVKVSRAFFEGFIKYLEEVGDHHTSSSLRGLLSVKYRRGLNSCESYGPVFPRWLYAIVSCTSNRPQVVILVVI